MNIFRTENRIIFIEKIQHVEISDNGKSVYISFLGNRHQDDWDLILSDKEALDFLMYVDMLVPNSK